MSASYPDLLGRTVLVTGGTGGIGTTLCRELAAQGVRVGICGRAGRAADQLAAELTAHGATAAGFAVDCTVPEDVIRLVERVQDALGEPDGLVCLAGGAVIEPGPTYLLTLRQWEDVIAANLTATFLTIAGFLPGMIARERGAIVTTAAAAARVPTAASAPYAVAKAGVVALTRHVAREVGDAGVRVNCVSPSVVETDRNVVSGSRREDLLQQHPLGRLGTAQDVAAAVLFLLSNASGWISGVTVDVAGGRVTG